MSDILAKLQAVHEGRQMVKVEVPEYGLDLYFPPLTLADRERIQRGVNPNDETALMVSGLIHQAKTKSGEPAFPDSPQMRAELHKFEVGVMMRIMAESGGSLLPSEMQAELVAIDAEALRAALVSALSASPHLAGAITRAPVSALRAALRDAAGAGAAQGPTKNG